MNLQELEGYLYNLSTAGLRMVNHIQNHHTWSPSYRNFNGSNHFAKLESMEADHIARGFGQIAQHFTTFPDGSVAICRSLTLTPTCIHMHNTGGICIENLGNFDKGGDAMAPVHHDTIIKLNALLCVKFGLHANTDEVVYHHWFRQSDGFRDNGDNDPQLKDHKTCPGTNFFGGNTVDNAKASFLPLVQAQITALQKAAAQPATVSGVSTGVVNAEALNVRTGPGTDYPVIDLLRRNVSVTILQTNGEWDQIGVNRWVNADYIATT